MQNTLIRIILAIITLSLPCLAFADEGNKSKGEAPAFAGSGPIGQILPPATWTDYQGREWKSSEFREHKGVVYAFLGTQCPLAKFYSAKLVDLEKEYRDRGVAFVAVDSNVQDSLAEMGAHAKKFGFEFPFVKDPDQKWADQLGVTRTPEVCLIDASGRLVYRGRVDDQYGIGYIRDNPTTKDLQNAIDAVLSSKEIENRVTDAPGCLIGRNRMPTDAHPTSAITYAEHVSHILQNRCVSCHRDGEIGPMDLSRYDDASAWADMILEVVQDRRMPPWHANPDHGTFANSRRMSQEEIETLASWVEGGTPRGDANLEPAPLPFVQGWQLPTAPDLVVPMAAKQFAVPARGDVSYQYFVADLKNTEDLWVRGMEVVPGNRAVVHHILVFAREKKARRQQSLGAERGFLVGYVPGTRVQFMPEGMAKRIPPNSELVFQVHYTPIGTPQEDLSKVGFWYADPSTLTHEIQTTSAFQPDLRIPPQEPNYQASAMLPEELPDCELLSMSPHMHLRGKAFRYTTILPDKTREIVLDIPKYDFNWQTEYVLSERKKLPAGSRVLCEAVFDNSEANLNNPNPDKTVTWGDQTYQEMMIGYFHIAVPIDKKLGAAKPLDQSGFKKNPTPLEIFHFLDTDGDGKLHRDQVPKRILGVFDQLDKNNDQILELSEVPK